jgi:hypothetical protein
MLLKLKIGLPVSRASSRGSNLAHSVGPTARSFVLPSVAPFVHQIWLNPVDHLKKWHLQGLSGFSRPEPNICSDVGIRSSIVPPILNFPC